VIGWKDKLRWNGISWSLFSLSLSAGCNELEQRKEREREKERRRRGNRGWQMYINTEGERV
jgi:hypothetical protein